LKEKKEKDRNLLTDNAPNLLKYGEDMQTQIQEVWKTQITERSSYQNTLYSNCDEPKLKEKKLRSAGEKHLLIRKGAFPRLAMYSS
jgi:hypothetical protein